MFSPFHLTSCTESFLARCPFSANEVRAEAASALEILSQDGCFGASFGQAFDLASFASSTPLFVSVFWPLNAPTFSSSREGPLLFFLVLLASVFDSCSCFYHFFGLANCHCGHGNTMVWPLDIHRSFHTIDITLFPDCQFKKSVRIRYLQDENAIFTNSCYIYSTMNNGSEFEVV